MAGDKVIVLKYVKNGVYEAGLGFATWIFDFAQP